jgi:hypothetical protein
MLITDGKSDSQSSKQLYPAQTNRTGLQQRSQIIGKKPTPISQQATIQLILTNLKLKFLQYAKRGCHLTIGPSDMGNQSGHVTCSVYH